MKANLKKATLFLILFFLVTAACAALSHVDTIPAADAAEYSGIVTVAYENNVYYYTDAYGNSGESPSLQTIIDLVEANNAQSSFEFVALPVLEPISFRGFSVAQGSLNFDFSQNAYAVTAKSGAQLTFSGMTVNSKRGGVMVEYGGKFKFLSGMINVAESAYSCSALNVRGETLISGGNIIYSERNEIFGYGLSVNGGKLQIVPSTPVRVEGHSALCIAAGHAEIGGGDFIANCNENQGGSSAGFSADVQDGELTISDGNFSSAIFDRRLSSNARFTVNGGAYESILSAPAASKYITVSETQIFAGLHCPLKINLTFSEDTVQLSGVENDGFRITNFDADGNIFAVGSAIPLSDGIHTVRPVEDNRRNIELVCDGIVYATKSYPYGTKLKISDLPSPNKKGYTLIGWQNVSDELTVTDDIRLTAITELSAPEITISDIQFVYDKSVHSVTPSLRHELDVSYTFLWEKRKGGGWESVTEEQNLPLITVADSGIYRFRVTAKYGIDEIIKELSVELSVKKGSYSNITHPQFNGVFDPDKRLFDYKLDAGYKWTDVSVIPTVPVRFYSAVYNDDPDNYTDFYLDIGIELTKAAPVMAPAHRNLQGIFEEKLLENYALSENFRWANPTERPVVNKNSYQAFYNPDRENYFDYVCYITLNLEKSVYRDDKKLPNYRTVFRENYTLKELNNEIAAKFPNYKLNYSQNYLASHTLLAGTTELSCLYNADPDNYHNFIFSLPVLVAKADYDATVIEGLEKVLYDRYSGKTLADYPLPPDVFWSDPDTVPTVNVQNYSAYYNADDRNYNNYLFTFRLILQKGEYQATDIVLPMLDPVVYDRNATLGGISLPNGWRWKSPSLIPEVKKSTYEAEFCDDEVNYQGYETEIPLTVRKADIPLQILSDKTVVYDGKPHSLLLAEPPYPLSIENYGNNGQIYAGRYEITVTLSQSDADNYRLHPTVVKGILTIEKAPSVIVAPARYDVLEGETPVITGRVDNSEQNLIIPSFSETTAGIYNLTLKTVESRNYLAGAFQITVSVNKEDRYIGNAKYPASYDKSYYYGILTNLVTGVPGDADIAFSAYNTNEGNKLGVKISVLIGGQPYFGKFTAKIRMTDEMLDATQIKLTKGGEEIAYHIENGVYLVFETDGNEELQIELSIDKSFAWWWIPIGIGIGLLVIGTVFMVLWKKGILKLPKATLWKKSLPNFSKKAKHPVEAETSAQETVEVKKEKEAENEKNDSDGQ